MTYNRLSIPLAEACQENASLRARIAELEAPPVSGQQSCPQCGPGAMGDEDGCCTGCGSTLCGAWVAELAARAEKAEAERDRYRDAIREWITADDEWSGSNETSDRLYDAEAALRRIAEEKP